MKNAVFCVLAILLALPAVSLAAVPIKPVPEPASGLLLLLGGAGVAAYRKVRGRK
jgi:hypothetical protein